MNSLTLFSLFLMILGLGVWLYIWKIKNHFNGTAPWEPAQGVVTIYSIMASLVFVNWLCANIEWDWWIHVHTQKNTLFWSIQIALVFAFAMFIFVRNQYGKFFGWFLIIICILGLFKVNDFSFPVDPPKRGQVTEYIERIPVRKGETRRSRIDGLKVIPAVGPSEQVTFKYRVDNAQDWKTHIGGTKWEFGLLDNEVEVTPIDVDLIVLEKRFVRR